jgi:hypothetical protein
VALVIVIDREFNTYGSGLNPTVVMSDLYVTLTLTDMMEAIEHLAIFPDYMRQLCVKLFFQNFFWSNFSALSNLLHGDVL